MERQIPIWFFLEMFSCLDSQTIRRPLSSARHYLEIAKPILPDMGQTQGLWSNVACSEDAIYLSFSVPAPHPRLREERQAECGLQRGGREGN